MKIQDYLRVLYAEDNEDASEMMTFLLELSEIEIIAAKSVAKAWQLTQDEYFDLYLLDSRFPDGNGLELCRRLRDQFPQTPIVFYSGEARESDKQKGLSAGADAYLVKPNSDNVALIIRQLTERAQHFSENRKIVPKKNGNANLSEYIS